MKRNLSLLFFLLAAVLSAEARNYIVCIGIADYPGTNSDLQLSSRDAATIKNVYEKNGDAMTDILMDSEATVENIKVTMDKLFSRATQNDAVILFFSGHGVPGGFVCFDGSRLKCCFSCLPEQMRNHWKKEDGRTVCLLPIWSGGYEEGRILIVTALLRQ